MIEYNFYNPTKLIFGADKVKKMGGVIAQSGYRKVLLIAGGGSIKENGVYDAVTMSLKDHDIVWAECWGVRSNPCLEKVEEAIAMAKREGVEAVLAVGGGSVIDSAKVVAAGCFVENVWDIFERKEKIRRALPIFTVLTLSATASEMNGNAVITNEREQKKYGIGHSLLYPKVSIIDPRVQMTLPWMYTVNGALDALAHVMEYYFVGSEEETSLCVDEALMKSIIKSVGKLKIKEDDLYARANLAWAVTMGLNGISGAGLKGGDWACHEISHSVAAMYPATAHGAALGIIFPAWMEYVSESNPHQFNRFARGIFDCIDIEEGVIKFRNLLRSWQAPTKLRDIGITKEDLRPLAEMSIARGDIGAVQKLKADDIEKILHIAF